MPPALCVRQAPENHAPTSGLPRQGRCKMRRLALLLFLAATLPPAFAAKPVTLDLVDQLLIYAHGKPDAKVAEQLFELELTERVSPARLARWEAELPGPKSRQAM